MSPDYETCRSFWSVDLRVTFVRSFFFLSFWSSVSSLFKNRSESIKFPLSGRSGRFVVVTVPSGNVEFGRGSFGRSWRSKSDKV